MERQKYPECSMRRACLFLAAFATAALMQSSRAGQFGLFTYYETATSVVISDYPDDATGVVVIPAEIDGKPVTKIEDAAFYKCAGITGVVIPESVTAIGGGTSSGAFQDCSSLTSITIPPGVSTIGRFSFWGTSLTSVAIPQGVTSIADGLFRYCANLTEVIIPESVTSIGAVAFGDCTSLESVAIPFGVSSIGATAFYNCTKLRSITIPPGVSKIDISAFRYCSSLAEAVIPASVTTIANSAFEGCLSLERIALPPQLTSIGHNAFRDCSGLLSVDIPASVSSIGNEAFQYCTGLNAVAIHSSLTSSGTRVFAFCSLLKSVYFLGNAPAQIGANTFVGGNPALTIYYQNGRSGYSAPTWMGLPSVEIGAATPALSWLIANNFSPTTPLSADPNRDGISLLTEYALNLNPSGAGSGVPLPLLNEGNLCLTFYAGRSDIVYTVQTSVDLRNWVTDGVSISPAGGGEFRTATVATGGKGRFMRLALRR